MVTILLSITVVIVVTVLLLVYGATQRKVDPYNDPRYEKIYAPLKAGKGTKENPLTMEDLQPLMEELRRLEESKK